MHPATECGVRYGRSPRAPWPTLQAFQSPPFRTTQLFGVVAPVAAWAVAPGTTAALTTDAQTIARRAFIPRLQTRWLPGPRSHDSNRPQPALGGVPPCQ